MELEFISSSSNYKYAAPTALGRRKQSARIVLQRRSMTAGGSATSYSAISYASPLRERHYSFWWCRSRYQSFRDAVERVPPNADYFAVGAFVDGAIGRSGLRTRRIPRPVVKER